jgi:uncharacterized protein
MRNPKFSVFKSEKKCLYYYRDAQGKIILTEEGFVTKQDCLTRIYQIKTSAPKESNYTRFDQYKAYCFHLKSSEGELIAGSIIFTTKIQREQVIRDLKKLAQTAPVMDLSAVSSELK